MLYNQYDAQLTDAYNVKLESALEQLSLNLRCDAVETNMASWKHSSLLSHISFLNSSHCASKQQITYWLNEASQEKTWVSKT